MEEQTKWKVCLPVGPWGELHSSGQFLRMRIFGNTDREGLPEFGWFFGETGHRLLWEVFAQRESKWVPMCTFLPISQPLRSRVNWILVILIYFLSQGKTLEKQAKHPIPSTGCPFARRGWVFALFIHALGTLEHTQLFKVSKCRVEEFDQQSPVGRRDQTWFCWWCKQWITNLSSNFFSSFLLRHPAELIESRHVWFTWLLFNSLAVELSHSMHVYL